MYSIQKRFLLFLLGCIPVRLFFVFIAKNASINWLPFLGYLALLPATGFAYIFFTDSRKTGIEVFGNKIWWNNLRPLHSFLYFMFSFNAIYKNVNAWIYLLIDVFLGLFSFFAFHYNNGDFAKLWL